MNPLAYASCSSVTDFGNRIWVVGVLNAPEAPPSAPSCCRRNLSSSGDGSSRSHGPTKPSMRSFFKGTLAKSKERLDFISTAKRARFATPRVISSYSVGSILGFSQTLRREEKRTRDVHFSDDFGINLRRNLTRKYSRHTKRHSLYRNIAN